MNWQRIADAILWYESVGYSHIDVPWAVPDWAVAVTASPLVKPKIAPDEILVGSAEQSFIYLDAIGQLPKGKFVACTPCFRPGDNAGEFHQPTFMKVELYRNDIVDAWAVDEMIMDAMVFFGQQLTDVEYVLERADDQRVACDINLNAIEVGSYGLRSHGSLQWVFGTGLAEPRFSKAKAFGPHNIPAFTDMENCINVPATGRAPAQDA